MLVPRRKAVMMKQLGLVNEKGKDRNSKIDNKNTFGRTEKTRNSLCENTSKTAKVWKRLMREIISK